MKIQKKYLVALIVVGFAVSACTKSTGNSSENTPDPSTNKSLALVSYSSCADLEKEVKEMLIGEMEKNADGLRNYCKFSNDLLEPVMEPAGGGEEMRSGAQATGTNLQEDGVDEADLIKTGANYVYAIVGAEVKIVKIWPFSEFREVSVIKPAGAPAGLYLADEKLIVLSKEEVYEPVNIGCSDPAMMRSGCIVPDYKAATIEEVYSVVDPANPVLIKRKSYSGNLLDSRRIGGALHMVLSSRGIVYPQLNYDLGIDYENLPDCSENGEPAPTPEMIMAIEKIKNENRALIESLTLADLMPTVGEGKEIACTDIKRSESAVGSQLLAVYSDAYSNQNAPHSKTVILSNGGSVYASKDALYVTAAVSPYGWWAIRGFEFPNATVLHRFSLQNETPSYSGSIEVEGELVDNGFAGSRYSTRFSMAQFSMSEYNGYLRVATTTAVYSLKGTNLDNRITVIQIANGSLSKTGEVTGIGRGEKIHAVRFIKDMGYVVTFKKTDPLFVVNLIDPALPKVEGELKVPGFSTYLHPLDEGHLIGLGFAADDEGPFAWTEGLKLALFDVTDPANPKEVGSREIGSRGSYSPAIEEHHAFTLDKNRGLLALPVDIYEGGEGGSDFGTRSFSGVMLFKVDLSGAFESAGNIIVEGNENVNENWPAEDEEEGPVITLPVPPWWNSSADVLRTVIIGNDKDEGIITLTSHGLMMNRIDENMSEVGRTF
jgi:hypothetical protein